MQEQQGNLEEPLSGLPGPRPFNKNNKRDVPMEDSNNKELNDIVSRATEALSSGKAFGGWTDKVDESSFKQMQVDREHRAKKIKAQRERESDGSNQKDEGTKVGVLSHVEHDGDGIQEVSSSSPKPKPQLEGVGRIGVAVREGLKGAGAGLAFGPLGALAGYALGDLGAEVTGIGKKKKTWDDK